MTVKEYLKEHLEGKYINGYKIQKIEEDPFIKGQLNLFTNETTGIGFGDMSVVKFFLSDKPNLSGRIYKENQLLSLEDRIINYRTTLLNRKCDDPDPLYNNVKEVNYGVAVIDNILNILEEYKNDI
jgi:hypothetical protein